ncbi:hypothetical protein ACER0A_012455 [Haloimpatiens sp. FM7315]|uniref:hypothetical protein n=1 Tax=Haloimpatiens sp. FM7315 TaxID=3298609 RepID=UPI0035A317FB
MQIKSKSKLLKFSILLGILTIIMLVFFSTYYFSINNSFKNYENNINSVVSSINKINDNIGSLYSTSEDTTKILLDSLPSKVNLLNNIKHKLNTINPSAKYKKSYEYLYKGLDNNILTYNHLINLLKEPLNKDYEKNINKLNDSFDSCQKYYTLFSTKNSAILLPNNLKNIIIHSTNYVYDYMRKERDKEISKNQIIEFYNKIDEVYSQFNSLKTDYLVQLKNPREDHKLYDSLDSKLDKDLEKAKNLKKMLYEISIPEDKMNIYNSLKNLLYSYDNYIQSFKYTVSIEKIKTSNKAVKVEELDALYIDANNKLSEVDMYYDSFVKLYNEFKKSIY